MLKTIGVLLRWINHSHFLRKPELKIKKKAANRRKSYTGEMHALFQQRKMKWKENIERFNVIKDKHLQNREACHRYEMEIQNRIRGHNTDPAKRHQILEYAANIERIRKAGKSVNKGMIGGMFSG
ncbi:hypothetical protein XU18_1082 [Perkinsela sp. CCAP 1560/4]|nr:hypothetical protein XU18_1082 [Perkinsela sp. CCAP 1560/4]|eukprot:KNH08369.1 hypothetical protein XU18_1082 [Perkinsela sp. CCAP 1560/4]